MRRVRVNLSRNSYEICVGLNLLPYLADELEKLGFTGKLIVITDSLVRNLHAEALKENLEKSSFKVELIEVPEGEEQKSLESAIKIYGLLSDLHAERTTPVLALGGGVIGDLAGFVAATYLRGLPLVQVPTTLLSQVDSSIGGKVGLDYAHLKNKIGAFYQPRLVVADIGMLKTLTPKDISDGLAEVIKYGVIWDRRFFKFVAANLDKVKTLDEEVLEEIVYQSAKIKAKVVSKDERDFGLRHILNFGHTVGHGLESASEFKLSHGEAVALGMLAEARISAKMGIFKRSELEELKSVLKKAGLPTKLREIELERVIEAIGHDKKIAQGKLKFILPKRIGKVFITTEVAPSLVKEVLADFDKEA